MIKVLIFLIVLFPSFCFAEASGYLFFGRYYGGNYRSLEEKTIEYRSGVHFEFKPLEKGPIYFIEHETYIDEQTESGGLHPVQINYKIGLKQKIGSFEGIIKHECLHPIDGVSKGFVAQDYTLIEIRYNF